MAPSGASIPKSSEYYNYFITLKISVYFMLTVFHTNYHNMSNADVIFRQVAGSQRNLQVMLVFEIFTKRLPRLAHSAVQEHQHPASQ